MTPEDLARESLGAISLDRTAKLSAGGDPQARHRTTIRGDKHRHESSGDSHTRRVRSLEIDAAPNPFGRRQPERRQHGYCSSDTVRRLRPFARRLFSTIRPFFVAMRTLNPCVFFRRRVFG